MKQNRNNNGGALFLGLIFGAAAGLAAGLLYAPEKGEKTRNKLKKKAKQFSEDLEKESRDIGQKAQEFAKEVERKIKDKLDESSGTQPKV